VFIDEWSRTMINTIKKGFRGYYMNTISSKSFFNRVNHGSQTSAISKFTNCTNCYILSSISFLEISFNLSAGNFSIQKEAMAEPTIIAVFIFSKEHVKLIRLKKGFKRYCMNNTISSKSLF